MERDAIEIDRSARRFQQNVTQSIRQGEGTQDGFRSAIIGSSTGVSTLSTSIVTGWGGIPTG